MKIKNITWETDGEFVEVYDSEVENFNILDAK